MTVVVDEPPAIPDSRPSAASMIVFDSVTKVYEPDVVALRDVTSTRASSSSSLVHLDQGSRRSSDCCSRSSTRRAARS
jgi:hypothetical protein